MKLETLDFEPSIWIKTFVIMIFTFMGIPWEVTSLLAGLILLDTITGVMKVIRLNLGFSVKELYWGLVTKMLILLIPHVIAIIGKVLGYDWLYLVNLTIYVMIANDFSSFITNVLSIKNKQLYKNYDFISMLINWFKEIIRRTIEEKLKHPHP